MSQPKIKNNGRSIWGINSNSNKSNQSKSSKHPSHKTFSIITPINNSKYPINVWSSNKKPQNKVKQGWALETRPSQLFRDSDRDGVADVFDCQPNNRRRQDMDAEEFISKRFPNEKDEGYKEEWRERFRGGNPEAFMDSESKRIFRKK